MTLVDKEKAIEILKKLQAERLKKDCVRNNIYEANALGYAIAILNKLEEYKVEDEKLR